MPAIFLPVGQHIVGPFHLDVCLRREVRDGIRGGDGGDEGELRAFARPACRDRAAGCAADCPWARSQTRPRRPRPAVCSSAVIQSGPLLAGGGEAARFLVRGIDRRRNASARSRTARRVTGNSACAAWSASRQQTPPALTTKNSENAVPAIAMRLHRPADVAVEGRAPARRNT